MVSRSFDKRHALIMSMKSALTIDVHMGIRVVGCKNPTDIIERLKKEGVDVTAKPFFGRMKIIKGHDFTRQNFPELESQFSTKK